MTSAARWPDAEVTVEMAILTTQPAVQFIELKAGHTVAEGLGAPPRMTGLAILLEAGEDPGCRMTPLARQRRVIPREGKS